MMTHREETALPYNYNTTTTNMKEEVACEVHTDPLDCALMARRDSAARHCEVHPEPLDYAYMARRGFTARYDECLHDNRLSSLYGDSDATSLATDGDIVFLGWCWDCGAHRWSYLNIRAVMNYVGSGAPDSVSITEFIRHDDIWHVPEMTCMPPVKEVSDRCACYVVIPDEEDEDDA